jgi:hypothetical protein
MRRTFDIAPKAAGDVARPRGARDVAAVEVAPVLGDVMPIAVIASALRRRASINVLRAAANCVALRVGRRVSISVNKVSVTR